MYFSKVKTKVKSISEHFADLPVTECNSKLMTLFTAYYMWLDDALIVDSNLHAASLAPCFLPELLVRTMAGEEGLWMQYLDRHSVYNDFELWISDWNRLHFRDGFVEEQRALPTKDSPAEAIVKRLRSHDGIVPLPPLRLGRELQALPECDMVLGNAKETRAVTESCLDTIATFTE